MVASAAHVVQGIDWEHLRETTPPHLPDINDAADTSNFPEVEVGEARNVFLFLLAAASTPLLTSCPLHLAFFLDSLRTNRQRCSKQIATLLATSCPLLALLFSASAS